MIKLNKAGFATVGALALIAPVAIYGSLFGIDERNTARGRGDAPVGVVNNDKRDVYQMPDRFSNFAIVCDKYGNAIYTNTRGEANAAIFALKDGCE